MVSIVYAVCGYFFLLLTVRVLKRRAGSGISMLDFVLIFLIGGVIILGTMAQDRSMTNAVCIVITVGFLHRTVAWAKSKSPRVGALVDGVPLVLVDRGQSRKEVMDHMRITDLDVDIATRAARVPSRDQVEYAVLERNGSISVIPKK
ncbi:DUF421 domain-containing protein [Occallatibacter savannae]|uniref:DUF421 domain-containing protein n=1 Tax=Occallatibacter savannae TaxID=1002691 RepID=UPI000D686707|nr:YetF domain-containing protein [Occallatibacter savannae]